MNDALLSFITTTALIIGAVFITAIALSLTTWIAAAAFGLVMLLKQARGDYEPDEETETN